MGKGAKGAIPYIHPLSLWTVGLQQRDFITCGFEQADLIIAVGYDLIEYSPKKWNPDGTTPIVHIGTHSAEIDSSYIPEVEVVGDIADALDEIGKRCDRTGKSIPFYATLRTIFEKTTNNMPMMKAFPSNPKK